MGQKPTSNISFRSLTALSHSGNSRIGLAAPHHVRISQPSPQSRLEIKDNAVVYGTVPHLSYCP
jgi:hypothetical protein